MDSDLVPEPDLWGRVLKEVHTGSRKPVAIRRDDGHLNTLPDYPHRYFAADLAPSQEKLLARLRGRVLDLGCGPGRHLLWLQARGVRAVGIDNSPGAVEVARSRGCRQVHVMDASELDFPDASFDAAIMLGNNLGIAGTLNATERLFAPLARIRPHRSQWHICLANAPDPRHTSLHLAPRRLVLILPHRGNQPHTPALRPPANVARATFLAVRPAPRGCCTCNVLSLQPHTPSSPAPRLSIFHVPHRTLSLA